MNMFQGLEVYEQHLIIDTVEETAAKLEEKIRKDMEHQLVRIDEDGARHQEYIGFCKRFAIEEQNTMTAIIQCIFYILPLS